MQKLSNKLQFQMHVFYKYTSTLFSILAILFSQDVDFLHEFTKVLTTNTTSLYFLFCLFDCFFLSLNL